MIPLLPNFSYAPPSLSSAAENSEGFALDAPPHPPEDVRGVTDHPPQLVEACFVKLIPFIEEHAQVRAYSTNFCNF